MLYLDTLKIWVFLLTLATLLVGCGRASREPGPETTSTQPPAPSSEITFNSVAPLVWDKCAGCHRDGEAAPFPLLACEDFQKRREQILEVLESGYMPPWLPSTEHVAYENDTRLTDAQQELLVAWLRAGAPQGDTQAAPELPTWPSGWRLGTPDLVVSLDRPFHLPAAGEDVYRNFVIPIPTERLRYVRAMEFRPGNYRVVHHAFMLIDPTRRLRTLTEPDGQPGFAGMDTKEALSPDGHFAGWQPGRPPYQVPPGMPWRLVPSTDLVLQVHMQCTGKPEQIQPSVGFYFTENPPERVPTKLALLVNDKIDIPANAADHAIENSFRLPVDVQVMAVAPHAHYLAKRMYGTAELPDGSVRELLKIEDWDLNWQSEYRFQDWIPLPAGTVLKQRFVYDNSADNVRNPHHPPQRVTFGPAATDEMGSLWIQVLTANEEDRKKLNRALVIKTMTETVNRKRALLKDDPYDVDANVQMGKAGIMMGRLADAIKFFQRAAEAHPKAVEPLYYWGHTLLRMGKLEEGAAKLRACLALDNNYYKVHHDLGQASYLAHDFDQAEQHYRNALAIHGSSVPTLKQLGRCLIKQGRTSAGIDYLQQSLQYQPDSKVAAEIAALKSTVND